MKITADALVISAVSLSMAAWLSTIYGWQMGAMYVAGLAWALFDENLLGGRMA
jgi:uncharacterized protein (DUF697 family)